MFCRIKVFNYGPTKPVNSHSLLCSFCMLLHILSHASCRSSCQRDNHPCTCSAQASTGLLEHMVQCSELGCMYHQQHSNHSHRDPNRKHPVSPTQLFGRWYGDSGGRPDFLLGEACLDQLTLWQPCQ